jgi:hypothetical protein
MPKNNPSDLRLTGLGSENDIQCRKYPVIVTSYPEENSQFMTD